jgi:hypothetical protein
MSSGNYTPTVDRQVFVVYTIVEQVFFKTDTDDRSRYEKAIR